MLLIADPHMLGPQRRHWIDIRWSDWGIQKALAAAVWVHAPRVVVVNGDVFDEGNVASSAQFKDAAARFHRIFAVGGLTQMRGDDDKGHLSSPSLLVASGNHDVGLGYSASEHLVDRFARDVSSTQTVECVANVSLVFLNTQVLHPSCSKQLREAEAAHISDPGVQAKVAQCSGPRRPLVFLHMPLYRPSDENCGDPRAEEPGRERAAPDACFFTHKDGGNGAVSVGVDVASSPGYCFGDSGGVTYKGRHARLVSVAR